MRFVTSINSSMDNFVLILHTLEGENSSSSNGRIMKLPCHTYFILLTSVYETNSS